MTSTKIRTSIRKLKGSDIETWAQEGTAFDAGNVWGREGGGDTGRLSTGWAKLYRDHQHGRETVLYTIYSYSTPIAWRTRKGWVRVGETFSISTTSHQSALYNLRPSHGNVEWWCKGSGASVEVLPKEQRPYGVKGNAGICPSCKLPVGAPNGVVEHHRVGPEAYR